MSIWAEERQQQILQLLREQQRVEAERLVGKLDVSRETIRRDLKQMELAGLIRRTHGGAAIVTAAEEKPFQFRLSTHVEEKQRIARAAIALVKPGNCCFVDAGSTTAIFATELVKIPKVSVITNSLGVAAALRAVHSDAEVVLLGGTLGHDVPATFGELGLEQLKHFRADLAFISPVGVDPHTGITYFDLAEAELAKQMLAHAHCRVVLADQSKIGVVSRVLVSDWSRIDVLVTDASETKALRQAGATEIVSA
jgi:DeoR/GlpR family transcriptional regulator of sugar metabolism